MSKIDQLIQDLQLKKKKIDYIEYIKDLLKGDQKCIDFVEIQEEVLAKVIPLLESISKEIEDGITPKIESQNNTQLSQDDVNTLKLVIEKAKGKMIESNTPSSPSPYDKKSQDLKKSVLSNSDKLNFAMNNRHLANKRVVVINKQGKEVSGEVVGLDAPYVVVRTSQGPVIQAELENVQIES
jgi:hypothetical protein